MKLIYLSSFLKDLKKVDDKKVKTKVKEILLSLKEIENIQNSKQIVKLKGHPTAYRIRIGNYRMGLFIEENTITLARFVKRNDIYKLFP
ncbi:MAG: plasmid stabilization protein [Flavobacteriales bacterium]|nr:plasmid stabilization protein [Flavobacteriales bacterium]